MPHSDVIRELFQRLDARGFEYAVGGSFASSAWGKPRQTNHLDLVLQLPAQRVEEFISAFQDDFMISVNDVQQALESADEYRGLQMLHFQELFKVDVFLHNDRPFDTSAFTRRVGWQILPGLSAPVFSAEDTILRKLQWYVLGNHISDRQWNDIVGVIEIRSGLLDMEYMRQWAARLGLTDLLEEALAEARLEGEASDAGDSSQDN